MSSWLHEASDPAEPCDWPDRVWLLHDSAIEAFLDGDPKPLADWIDAGFVITDAMRHHLTAALRGVGPVKVDLQRTGLDRQPHSEKMGRYFRDVSIGVWIERHLRDDPKLKYKDAVADAARHFGVGKEVARIALANVRRQLRGDVTGFPIVDLVSLSEAVGQDAPAGENPAPKRRVRPK
jgi:hypothetical protein